MNTQTRNTLLVVAGIAGAMWLWQTIQRAYVRHGYEAVSECVAFSKELGQRFNSANTQDLTDDQRDLAAYRFCATDEGWEYWREMYKATAPSDDRPEL